ncbi:MAG: M67 family metallopeptidase [Candidatus Bathyarchaeota archaeon]|nr:M67 family metallopeptidase [Candidatus Bathyarchaeota archaeon]
MIVRLEKKHVKLLVDRAREEHPVEICGTLFGLIHGNEAHVIKIIFLKNVLRSESMFQIDSEEFLNALLSSEEEGLQHIGFFHSHSGDVKPSAIDLKYMAFWPESIWLIVSSTSRRIAAYEFNGKNFHEIPIVME